MGAAPPHDRVSGDEKPGLHPGFETSARLWLVRHAEVREDFRGQAYGSLDVPLSEAGRRDSARLAEEFGTLDLAAVATSPLSRARELAEGIAERSGAPLRVENALAEIDRGSWQGRAVAELPAEEVTAFYDDPWSWSGHGGENDAQVLCRAWPVVADLVQHNPGRELAIVAHYNVIRMIVAHAIGIPASSSFSLRIDPGRAALLIDVRADPCEDRTEVPQRSGWVLRHSNVRNPLDTVGVGEGER